MTCLGMRSKFRAWSARHLVVDQRRPTVITVAVVFTGTPSPPQFLASTYVNYKCWRKLKL